VIRSPALIHLPPDGVDHADEPLDIDGLDGPACRNRELVPAAMPTRDVARAGLSVINAETLGDRLELLHRAVAARIGPHSRQ